jgi:hypothetical protein
MFLEHYFSYMTVRFIAGGNQIKLPTFCKSVFLYTIEYKQTGYQPQLHKPPLPWGTSNFKQARDNIY